MSATTKETLGFQAEVKQLLQLMIHSLYSNKDIFLRELISNASDAADKLRFEALTDAALFENDTELKIRVAFDREARTLTITDNGIGMSRQEVIEHIGTIAKSGTREFFSQLSGDQKKDAALIGQFGVGFYSAFIVADRVTLTTRRAGLTAEHGVRWESEGAGDYTLETVDKPGARHRDRAASARRRGRIPVRLEDQVGHPHLFRPHHPAHRDEEDANGRTAWKCPTDEDETVNQASALWARAKKDISDEEYHEFYKHVAHDFEPPLAWSHNRVEGKQEYISLLYLPSHAPFDLYDRAAAARHQALRAPRLHHGRRRAADAAIPALRARGDRLVRPAAQRLARNPPALAGHRGDPRRFGEEGAGPAGRPGREPAGGLRRASGRNSAGC